MLFHLRFIVLGSLADLAVSFPTVANVVTVDCSAAASRSTQEGKATQVMLQRRLVTNR